MTACPICELELDWRAGKAKDHLRACEAIEMGLLADQLTPEVDELPAGYDYPEWPKPDVPYGGSWRG